MRGIEAQFLALQKGFNEIIPQHLLKPFDERELEVIFKFVYVLGMNLENTWVKVTLRIFTSHALRFYQLFWFKGLRVFIVSSILVNDWWTGKDRPG